LKILIIDDEPLVRLALGYGLSLEGWEIIDHDQHADFLVQDQAIDAIITDYQMAETTGLDVIEKLRNAGISIPALILSGNVHAIDRERANRLGVSAIVAKPAVLKNLCRIVARSVEDGKKGL